MLATQHDITGATNASPIVITTATAHGLGSGQVVRIEGVVGNEAANGTWHILVLSPTTYSIAYASRGNSSGSGAYSSGGVSTGPLGSITAVVGLLSGELIAKLAERGLPPLSLRQDGSPGRIELGSEKVNEHRGPQVVIFVPDTSDFGISGYQKEGGTANVATIRTSAERRAQLAARSLMQEELHFRVHVWGQYGPAEDNELDYDATRELYHSLIKVMHDTSVAIFTLTKGVWSASAVSGGPQVAVAGREMVFGVSFKTPVLDDAFVYTTGVSASPTTKIHPADPNAAEEIGCSS